MQVDLVISIMQRGSTLGPGLGRAGLVPLPSLPPPLPPPLPACLQTRKLLEDFYRPYNQKLVRLLGEDRYLWRDTAAKAAAQAEKAARLRAT